MINQLGYYLKANGTICKIKEINSDTHLDYNFDTDSKSYYQDGSYYPDEASENDIIAYIPQALQFEILRVIEAYHTTDSFKSMIDNCYKKPFRKERGINDI